MERAIATLESISVARGYLATDSMLKAADVSLLWACTICPGKYLVVVGGQVSAVRSALAAGLQAAGEAAIDHMVLPNVHPDVFAALADATDPGIPKDLGVIETMAAPVALEAADAAVKAAQVKLLEIRLGRGMGAKSFFSLTGEISNVKTAVAAARAVVGERGFLVDAVVISRPHRALLEAML